MHHHRHQEDLEQLSLGLVISVVQVVVDVHITPVQVELLVVLDMARRGVGSIVIHILVVGVMTNGGHPVMLLIGVLVVIILVLVAVVLVVLAQHLALETVETVSFQVVLAGLYHLDMLILNGLLGVVVVDVMMYQTTGQLILHPMVELVHPLPIVEVGLKHYALGPLLVD